MFAGVVTIAAPDKPIGEAPVFSDTGDAQDIIGGAAACGTKGEGGTGRRAERDSTLLGPAPVAPSFIEAELRSARRHDSVFDMSRTNDVARTRLDASLASNAGRYETTFILDERRVSRPRT